MVKARLSWIKEREEWKEENLVFLDETGLATNMTRRYGRSQRGKRCLAKTPFGHWHTNTFIAGLRSSEVIAPMVLDGPMNGDCFLAYLREFLAPTLRKGDIVIADNLSCHKVSGVKEIIESVGAKMLYLPPYSPDLNPIEMFFSKLKALLRRVAERTIEGVTMATGDILNDLNAVECENFFRAAGYCKSLN